MIIKMKANELRQKFFNFFKSKNHEIVASASMVIRDDPTLMFTNAGMNQFKDVFLGNKPPHGKRIANSQKCLRVSGKHNDLEEVGKDTYHHTMFEMLGNWSFGDYFKKEAINWAWEFLTEILKIDKDQLYVTIFEGDESKLLERDQESYDFWAFNIEKNRILEGSSKDNFWEMGETGPCGPCSEIHIDIRDESERKKLPGHELVNKGHPQVIEIWNLVFIQYNRKVDGSLEFLPSKHVDTGMGFERLCMVVQGKKSNYDTDIFQSVIGDLSAITGKSYGKNESWDVAMRVIADHLRAVSFAIADGQLPSNNKAGYVIRRILRRAVRYGYNNLGIEEPFIYRLVPALVNIMGGQYPELKKNEENIANVILQEEKSFLKTLGKGLRMVSKMISDIKKSGKDILPGDVAFELFDTYGFPVDLTQLILKEHNMNLDIRGFEKAMGNQKERSRDDAVVETGDWQIIKETDGTEFTGFEKTEDEVLITKYRRMNIKGKENFQLIFNRTPFYAESGGQVGDTGFISNGKEKIQITNTIKENNLIIHITDKLPLQQDLSFKAVVDQERRVMTANNHTATHLIHFALRSVLGPHVEQKGSLVTPERLRFDFSHFSKMTRMEIMNVEGIVNRMVRQNHKLNVYEGLSLETAKKMGALALFGEKYGETVRVVEVGTSVELCGGTHVSYTGNIGLVKIISEGAIASGIRRIEALTACKAEEYINNKLSEVDEVAALLKSKGNITGNVEKLISENTSQRKTIDKLQTQLAVTIRKSLEGNAENIGGFRLMTGVVEADSADLLKTIAHLIRNTGENVVLVIGCEISGKANLLVMVSDMLLNENKINAISIIKEISSEIGGGGGGQPFLATAGGKNPEGLQNAICKAKEYIRKL
jgi:alanyl-tRNA synthetase